MSRFGFIIFEHAHMQKTVENKFFYVIFWKQKDLHIKQA